MTIEKQFEEPLNWLMYRSYEFNRERSPDIEPERWRKLYFNADAYEKIYQEKKQQCLFKINLKNLESC